MDADANVDTDAKWSILAIMKTQKKNISHMALHYSLFRIIHFGCAHFIMHFLALLQKKLRKGTYFGNILEIVKLF